MIEEKTACRIAFVTGVGRDRHWAGGSESVYQILRHMKGALLVVTTGPHGLTQRLREEGRPVVVVPLPQRRRMTEGSWSTLRARIRKIYPYCRFAWRLVRVLRHHRVRLVYATDSEAIHLAPLPSRLAGAKVVLGIRGRPGAGRRWEIALRASHRVIALSQEMAEELARSFPHLTDSFRSKLRVIYNGVDLNAVGSLSAGYERCRARLGLSADDVVLLYVGAFDPGKAQLPFVEEVGPAFFRALPGEARAHVVFVGGARRSEDQEYERSCREAAEASGFGQRIHFAGFQENVWPWYAAADIVVLASRSEGMPRAVVEAMGCGKPVVSYDVTSVSELLLPSNAGIVVRQGDAVGMAGALARLTQDEGLRREMGERGRAFARAHLDIRAIARKYEDLFAELL